MQNVPAVVAAAKKHLIEFTPEELDIIKRQLFPPDATEEDINFCLEVARTLGLNPLTKQIYFVPRRANVKENGVERWVEKTEPMIGRDSLLTFAHRSKELLSLNSSAEIREYPQMDTTGNWKMLSTLVATAEVYRKGFDKPFTAEVSFNEYAQKNKDGKYTKFWLNMPVTMLKKVAESQALKKAFNIDDNILTPEESGIGFIDESGDLVRDPEVVDGVVVEGEQGKLDAPAVNAAKTSETADKAQNELDGTTGAGVTAKDELPLDEQDQSFLSTQKLETTLVPLITAAQAEEISNRISEYGMDYGQFLQFMEVSGLAEIPQSKYGTAIAALESRRRMNETKDPKGPSSESASQMDLLGSSSENRAEKMNQVVLAVMAKNLSPQVDEEAGLVVVKLGYGDSANRAYLKSLDFEYDGATKCWKWTR